MTAFVKILSPGRANESRLNSLPASPAPNSNQSLDNSSPSATSLTPEIKRSIVKEPPLLRSSLEEDHGNKKDSLGVQQPSSPGAHSIVGRRISPDRKNIAVYDDPDLK